MKKLFSLLTIVFIFMGFGLSVQAEESDTNTYYCNWYLRQSKNGDNYLKHSSYENSFTLPTNCKIALYWICPGGNHYILGVIGDCGDGKIKASACSQEIYNSFSDVTFPSEISSSNTISSIFKDYMSIINSMFTLIEYNTDMTVKNTSNESPISSSTCKSSWFSEPCFKETSWTSTNIPIFSDFSLAYNWITTGEGLKDAENYEDLVGIVYDLEVPQDLKVSYNDSIFEANAYSLKWKQNDENYKNWKTEIYVYADFEAYEGILGIQTGDKYIYEDEFIYGESIDTYKLKYTLDTGSDIYEYGCEELLDKIFNENLDLTACYEKEFHIYIRNYYFDGELKHYSNWVLVNIDYDFVSGDDSSSVIEIGGSIDDSPGASTPDEDIKGEVNNDSQYDGTVNGNVDSSSDDIFSWIKNGFGLLGDNGLLALLTDTFAYIPDFIWAILAAGLGIFVMIAGAKYLFG